MRVEAPLKRYFARPIGCFSDGPLECGSSMTKLLSRRQVPLEILGSKESPVSAYRGGSVQLPRRVLLPPR